MQEQQLQLELYFAYDYDNTSNIGKEIVIPTIPKNVGHTYNPHISTQQILGRITPLNRYNRGGDETYSFNIEIHNDMLINQRLHELVEDIKMLSMPIERNGVQTTPHIYFSLGELNGFCIVDTTHEWKAPIINGHYAIVDISFTIRITRPMALPQMERVEFGEGEVNTRDIIYSGYTDLDYNILKQSLEQGGYDTSIEDFLTGGYDPDYRNYLIDTNTRLIDQQKQRLSDLYGVMIKQEYKDDSFVAEIEKDLGWLRDIKYNVVKDQVIITSGGKKISKKKYIKLLNNYKKKYWDQTESTQKQSDTIFSAIIDIIENIETMENEVTGYAAWS